MAIKIFHFAIFSIVLLSVIFLVRVLGGSDILAGGIGAMSAGSIADWLVYGPRRF